MISELVDAEILLDGLLGTGIKLPLRSPVDEVLETVGGIPLRNGCSLTRVVAVDCPSGIDCDSGEAAENTLTADLTVCMAAVKEGLLKLPGLWLSGRIGGRGYWFGSGIG